MFYEGLKGLKDLHKTFWGTSKKCENKNLNFDTIFSNARGGKVQIFFEAFQKDSKTKGLIFLPKEILQQTDDKRVSCVIVHIAPNYAKVS